VWIPKARRRRRAVLFALTAAGAPGMSVSALGVAADLPEAELQALLLDLTAGGRVRCLPGTIEPVYRCTVAGW
jgi:hypothetical protein